MNFDFKKLVTPTGLERLELRVWDFGPGREDMTLRFKDKTAMFKALKELEAEEKLLFNPLVEMPVEVVKTFGELFESHKKNHQNTFAAGWLKNLDGYWKYFEPKLAKLPYTAVTPSLLKTFQAELLALGNSQKTVNLKIGFIRSIMKFAWHMEAIPENKSAKYQMTKPPEKKIGYWLREDAEDFLKFAAAKYPQGSPDRWKYSVYLLGVNAGLRAGEIWALKPRCLRRSLGIMQIDEQWGLVKNSDGQIVRDFSPPKGKGPRTVPLNDEVADELEALIEANGIGRNSIIFSNDEGNPICHDDFKNRVFDREFKSNVPMNIKPRPEPKRKYKLKPKPAPKTWDGPQINFHGLRHTFGTLMISDKVDVKTLQAIMGHKDLITTMGYVHAVSENVRLAGKSFSVKPAKTKLKVVTEL
jgi:integrase